jgi:NTP pyrophosphatase (non-canonical NTP hydrolase)
MNSKTNEVMDILQEECAEVIQIVSKIRRFGIDEIHLKRGMSNREMLCEEVGDVLCMVELLRELEIIDDASIQSAVQNKRKKLEQWSTIFKEETV